MESLWVEGAYYGFESYRVDLREDLYNSRKECEDQRRELLNRHGELVATTRCSPRKAFAHLPPQKERGFTCPLDFFRVVRPLSME
jgi:hypothetical protein